jgi:hypothetical protein
MEEEVQREKAFYTLHGGEKRQREDGAHETVAL